MNRSIRLALLTTVAAAAFTAASTAHAVTFTTNGYSQNFNSMGTGTSAPSGWSVYSISGDHDDFAPSDSSHPGDQGLPDGSEIRGGTSRSLVAATPGSQKSNQGYNWAVGGSSTERSLGTSPTGIAGVNLQLSLTNNSGQDITALSIAYDIRRFSVAGNGNGYNTSAYYGKEELPGYWLFYSLDNGATYTNVASLNPDGHTWSNTVGITGMADDNVVLSGTWAQGTTLLFRWFDDNAQSPSPDQLIGLDNLAITAVPEPTSLALIGIGTLALLRRRRNDRGRN